MWKVFVSIIGISGAGCGSIDGSHPPHAPPGWGSGDIDDCLGNDQSSSLDSATPLAANCATAAQAGQIAICWDQVNTVNPAMSGPWCTYKTAAASPCSGGPHPGQIYICYQP